MKTLILLMGGKSSRMGADKARLELNGRSILERIIDEVSPHFSEIILSTNEPERYKELGLPSVPDEVPDCGPVGGLLSVMNKYQRERYQVAPCDTPFISGAALVRSFELSEGADVGLVRTPDGPQPLFSAYSAAARGAFKNCVECGVFKILDCIKSLNVRELTINDIGLSDEWEKVFFNVNRPVDLERAIEMDRI